MHLLPIFIIIIIIIIGIIIYIYRYKKNNQHVDSAILGLPNCSSKNTEYCMKTYAESNNNRCDPKRCVIADTGYYGEDCMPKECANK